MRLYRPEMVYLVVCIVFRGSAFMNTAQKENVYCQIDWQWKKTLRDMFLIFQMTLREQVFPWNPLANISNEVLI